MARPIVKYLDPISGEYEFATVVDVGDLRDLNTTIKSDIVGAINSIISDGVHNPINNEKIEDLERIINSLKDGTFKIDDFGSIDEYLKQQFLDELDKINKKNREEIQSVLTQLDTSVDDAIKDYQEKVAAQNIILENAENTLADARGTLEAKAAELETAQIGLSELEHDFNELEGYISTNIRTIDFDNFNAMVEDYESVVTQTSDEVGVDMSGSTLSYLTGRVTDAEANISLQADEITSKMGYDEFQYMPVPKYDYGENLLFDTFDFGDAWSGKNGAQVTPDTFLFGKVVTFNSPTGLYETRTDDLTIGESYVFSTYVNVQPSSKEPSEGKYEPVSSSYDPTDFKIQIGGKSFNPGVYEDLSGINGWVRINQEFVADAVNPIISITPTGVNSQNEVAYMAMPKVEKELTVTPWQPHIEDKYATMSSTQSMMKQQANSITAFVTEVSELDDSYKQATSTFQMLADGFAANTEAVEVFEDTVERYGTEYSNINGKFEQKVWKDDFEGIIEDINIDNRNRVLNSDFIRSEISSSDRRLIVEDWSLNSDWEIKTIDDNKYLSRNRTGLTQNLITSASSNYFPVRDGERTLFGFDLIHSGLDNDKVFAIELFDISDKRLLKEEFSLSSLTKVGNRYHGSFNISTPGVQKGRVVLQLPKNGSVSFTKISFQNADIGSIDWSPAPEDSWIIQSKLETHISQVEDEITIGGVGRKMDTLTGLLTEDKGTFTLNPDKIATEVFNSETYDDMGFVNKTNFEQTADGWMQEITSKGRLAGYINATPDTYRISFDKIMLEGTTWADRLGSSKIMVTENFALMGEDGIPVLDVNKDGSINMNVSTLKVSGDFALTSGDKKDIEKEVTDKVIKTTEPYIHIAYADTEKGAGLSFNPSGKQYIGFAKSHLPTPSGTASNYEWSKYVGDAGKDGVVGKDGVGLIGTNINYATSTSGTIRPNDWGDEVPTTQPGDYLWTKTTWYYSDNTSEDGYSVSRIGKDGNTGKDGLAGKDGVGIKSTVIDYATSSSGTVKPTSGWDSTVPSVSPGNYLWTRTVWTYTDNDVETGYSVSRVGKDGAKGDTGPRGPQGIEGPSGSNGQSQWVHIRYSPNSNGSGMDTKPSSTTKYVGIAVTNSATAPAYTGFTWSKYVGEDGDEGPRGVPGKNGNDGKTTYTWVRYADTPTSGMNQYPDGKKYIGLAFNKSTQDESEDYSDYQWSLMPQNIEIGGRNLLRGTANFNTPLWRNVSTAMPSTRDSRYKQVRVDGDYTVAPITTMSVQGWNFEVGQEYVISVWAKSEALGNKLGVTAQSTPYFEPQVVAVSEWRRFVWKFKATISNLTNFRFETRNGERVWITQPQIEKGSVPTDWSPAPEDVQANIDSKAESGSFNQLVKTVTTESERLDAIDTVVESTKNNFLITHTDEYVNKITTTESTVEGLESRVVSVEETKENVDTFFQFDDAFTIGKSNAQTKLRMTNDEIQFLDGETKGTYITGNTMVSQNMQIQDKLNLPKHTFETEGDITVVKYIG